VTCSYAADDGLLNSDELLEAVRDDRGPPMSEEDSMLLLAMVDKDGDAYVDASEFGRCVAPAFYTRWAPLSPPIVHRYINAGVDAMNTY
jgi:hypothetical protein